MNKLCKTKPKLIELFADILVESFDNEKFFNPNLIAGYFAYIFNIKPNISKTEVIKLAYYLGVNKIIIANNLSGKARGCFSIYKDNIEIAIKKGLKDETFIFTILHEMYEIICGYISSKTKFQGNYQREASSNRFAACVLMPEDIFLQFLIRSNYDPYLMVQKYNVNYFALILRIMYIFNKYGFPFLGMYAIRKDLCTNRNKNKYEYNNYIIEQCCYTDNFPKGTSKPIFESIFPKIFQYNESDTLKSDFSTESTKVKIHATPFFDKYNKISKILIFAIPPSVMKKLNEKIIGITYTERILQKNEQELLISKSFDNFLYDDIN